MSMKGADSAQKALPKRSTGEEARSKETDESRF